MAGISPYFEERYRELREAIDVIDSFGDLSQRSYTELLDVLRVIDSANEHCNRWEYEHILMRPSVVWFCLGIFTGFGGLLIFDLETLEFDEMKGREIFAFILTIGGVVGAAKSVYDQFKHFLLHRRIITLHLEVIDRISVIKAELRRRGCVLVC